MSTSLPQQLTLDAIRLNNYMSLIVLTAVGYDYVLTLSKEVEYIWTKTWSRVSIFFILARYVGLFGFVITMFQRTTFITGPIKLYFQGVFVSIVESWTSTIFIGAADAAMILRIWAMYGRSKLILYTLLVFLFLEIIAMTLDAAMSSANVSALIGHSPYASLCVISDNISVVWLDVATFFRLALGAVMCILAIGQFVRQSMQMYRATKQWQLNRYMNLLIRQGVIYFFAIFLYNIVNVLYFANKIPKGGWPLLPLFILEFVPLYTLVPRFILSIREMYAYRSVRFEVHQGNLLDTGFGLGSFSLYTSDGGVTTMVFAGDISSEGSADGDALGMEVEMSWREPGDTTVDATPS